jgi:hypothetical protein
MGILVFFVFVLAALWAGDRYFYEGRYFKELWFDANNGLKAQIMKFNGA